jgi:hypothetical protein
MKTLLFDFAIRLLGAANARRTLETAVALYALAEHCGTLTGGERGRWDEAVRGHEPSPLAPGHASAEEFRALLASMEEDVVGSQVIRALKRVADRRTLRATDAAHSTHARQGLLAALAAFINVGGDYLPEDLRVKLAAAALVVYLYDLRQYGEVTMGEEEQVLFRRVLGQDLGLAATVTYAQYQIWFGALAEYLGFCGLGETDLDEEQEPAAAGRG